MYAPIDIGNLCMTCELLEGNPRTLMYAGFNADSRIQYVSCNEDSHIHNSTLRKIYSKLVLEVNTSQVMPIYSALENFNPSLSFCVPT